MRRWIRVSKKHPEEWKKVLAYADGLIVTAVYVGDGKWRSSWDHATIEGVVTHWMPLPKMPRPMIPRVLKKDRVRHSGWEIHGFQEIGDDIRCTLKKCTACGYITTNMTSHVCPECFAIMDLECR